MESQTQKTNWLPEANEISINQLAFNFWEANQGQDEKQHFARNREAKGSKNITKVQKINGAYYVPDNMNGEALKKHLVKESVNTQIF